MRGAARPLPHPLPPARPGRRGEQRALGLHVWLFAGGLFVAYSALMVPIPPGLRGLRPRRAPVRRGDAGRRSAPTRPFSARPTPSSTTCGSACRGTRPRAGRRSPSSSTPPSSSRSSFGAAPARPARRDRVAAAPLATSRWSEAAVAARRPLVLRAAAALARIGACASRRGGVGSPSPPMAAPTERSGSLVESKTGFDPRIIAFHGVIALLLLVLARRPRLPADHQGRAPPRAGAPPERAAHHRRPARGATSSTARAEASSRTARGSPSSSTWTSCARSSTRSTSGSAPTTRRPATRTCRPAPSSSGLPT